MEAHCREKTERPENEIVVVVIVDVVGVAVYVYIAVVAIDVASLDATTSAAAVAVGIINVGVVCVMEFCEEYCRCCVSFILRCSISVARGIAVIIYWNST